MTDQSFNVLFLCTGNSARSIMAEAILNKVGAGKFRAYSAGSQPKGQVHPHTIQLLQSLDYDTSGLRSKSWNEFAKPGAPSLDFVFTVCDNAAGEACPVWPGQPMTAHWGIPDPAEAKGTPAEIALAFKDTYRMLQSAHRHFHGVAAALARSAELAKQAERDRPHGGRDVKVPSRPDAVACAAPLPNGLGTAFLLAAVVGSGIMAQKLAGGNGALALLCNTLPTGAILTVLILTFGPLSGAHFNPAVSIAFALRGELPVDRGHLHRRASDRRHRRRVDGASDVRTAAVASVDHGAHGAGPMVGGSGRHLRPAADDLRLHRAHAGGRALRGRPLHHGRVLVHRLDVVRKSGRDDRALAVRHLRGHRSSGRAAFIAAQLVGMLAAVFCRRWFWSP